MADELYPSDGTLNALAGADDAEQEVRYPDYTSEDDNPHYTPMYKLIQRLLKVARRGGDLRVFKDGALTFGVRAGKYFNGDTAVNYSEVTAQSLTNNQTNYIYLTAAGVLTKNTTGFPTPSATPHIPLATILTASGAYDGRDASEGGDITDYRGRGILHVASAATGALLNEMAAFFAATNITGAEAETLTDGSNADGKHIHDPLATAIADPGDAGAVAVTKSGTCPLVTTGAETRTLAVPPVVGRVLSLGFKTDGGDCVITVASAVNQAGNNTLTFADAGDHIMLIGVDVGGTLFWRVICNDGVALSTV